MSPVDALIDTAVHPVLKAEDFRRRKRTWNRLRNGFIDVMDVQTASHDRNTFTINVGLMVPELYELVHGRKPVSFVEEPECVVRERIGWLLKRTPTDRGFDKWWELASETDQLNCERELGDILPERLLPFFAQFSCIADVRRYLEQQEGFQRKIVLGRLFVAAARHRVGDVEGATRELMEARPRAGSWMDRVDALQKALSRNPKGQPAE